VSPPSTQGYLRIGELARRVGLSPDVLRAWERRYDILDPERSAGGFRLYSDADLDRVVAMQRHLAAGLAPAQAAARARAEAAGIAPDAPAGDLIAELRTSLEGFDEAAAHRAIDQIIDRFSTESLISNVVFPYLRDVGDRWENGEITVAQEHFASRVLRSRLIGCGRGWDDGTGPRAVLACAPGELHDLPLVCLGLALRDQGWRITLLGADTPIDTIIATAGTLRQEMTVLAFMLGESLDASRAELGRLARSTPLVLAGPGATAAVAARIGATYVNGDPVLVARRLTDDRPIAAADPAPARERAGGTRNVA
jgi:MerR family transcriptional regulator, light-induced transcriptional regulator